MDHKWLNLGPTWLFLGLMSAEGHLKLALAVPGSPWAGPYDPVGAPYGRRGHGRLRCRPTVRPGVVKGLIVDGLRFLAKTVKRDELFYAAQNTEIRRNPAKRHIGLGHCYLILLVADTVKTFGSLHFTVKAL